jgi:hypothetical protein
MHAGADFEHRLKSDRFARILDSAAQVAPHDDLEVEIEYNCCVMARYPVAEMTVGTKFVDLILTKNRTQCLAILRAGAEESTCCQTANCC